MGWVHIFSSALDDGAPDDNFTFIEANAAGYCLGFDMDNIGDLNNDGLDELAVGAPGVDQAYVFSGADLQSGGNLTISDSMSNVAGTDFTGLLVSQMGDVDGDGVLILVLVPVTLITMTPPGLGYGLEQILAVVVHMVKVQRLLSSPPQDGEETL